MGRERVCDASLGEKHGEVRAMLESGEILLRGSIRATLPFTTLRALLVRDGRFEARTDHGALSLALGAKEAAIWLDRIEHPPSLADKLGVGRGSAVHVVDDHPEPCRILTNVGAAFVTLDQATLVFVVIENAVQLSALTRLAPSLPSRSRLWVLRRKGAQADTKESTVMAALKSRGLGPNKTVAWSDSYSADRYGNSRK